MSAERFHHLVGKYGGRLDTALLSPSLAHDFEYMRGGSERILALLKEDHGLSVHFDFIASGKINAAAFKDDDKYYIGMYYGPIYMARLVFGRALSDPKVLPRLGSAASERRDLPLMAKITPDAEVMFHIAGEPLVPRDPIRRGYATNLFNHVYEFLFAHEVAHILHGHVDYRAGQGLVPFVAESGNAPDEESVLDRRCQEVLADMWATHLELGGALGRVNEPKMGHSWDYLYLSEANACFDWFFAISCLFRIFGDSRIVVPDLVKVVYPPPRVRQELAVSVGCEFAGNLAGSLSPEKVAQIADRAMLAAEQAFEIITGSQRSVQGILDSRSAEVDEYFRTVEQHYTTSLRDRLASFAHTPLPTLA